MIRKFKNMYESYGKIEGNKKKLYQNYRHQKSTTDLPGSKTTLRGAHTVVSIEDGNSRCTNSHNDNNTAEPQIATTKAANPSGEPTYNSV